MKNESFHSRQDYDLNQMEFGTFCTQWKTLGFGTAYLMLTFI